jgi:hypothetical protein
MAAVGFIPCSAPPGYVMLNTLKDSRHFPDSSSCYKIMLCLHWNLVHEALHVPSEIEFQWSQVRGARGQGYWASTSNPSVDKYFIQILTDINKGAGAPSCRNHISRRTSKGTTSSSSGNVPWRNVG